MRTVRSTKCAHAYLAAERPLLFELSQEPNADHKSIEARIGKIEVEMIADGASLNLCRYSDEPFNTNEDHLAALGHGPLSRADARRFWRGLRTDRIRRVRAHTSSNASQRARRCLI
jgi:hypothetical protein